MKQSFDEDLALL